MKHLIKTMAFTLLGLVLSANLWGNVTYEKVTKSLTDWSGDYLIVYENNNVAFDGSLTTMDATPNTFSVTISDGTPKTITLSDKDAADKQFTITATETSGEYYIQSASGYYIWGTSSNGLSSSNGLTGTTKTNTIAWDNNTFTIKGKGGSKTLSFNNSEGQKKFRYLGTTLIQLYKKQAAACQNSITITKGTESNGTFTLSQDGDVCIDEGNASVVVTGTPNSHYIFSSVTAEGATIGDISDNKCTVSNISQNTTITANFTAAPTATITLSEAGTNVAGPTDKYVGESYTLPSSVTNNCDPKIFVGWSSKEITTPGAKPTSNFYESGEKVTLAADNTFYAVFADASSGGSTTETLTVGTNGATWTNQTLTESATVGNVLFTALHSNGNSGKYYSSDNSWRFYDDKDGLTISTKDGSNITQVVITWKTGAPGTPTDWSKSGTNSPYTYTTSTNTNSVTFLRNGTNVLFQEIAVTYLGGTSYSNYSTTCSSDPTIEGLEISTTAVPEDGKYWEQVTATINCETEDVTITYSLDDGETWNPYEGGVQISSTTTLKAKATRSGYQDATTSKTFTFGKVYADIDAWYADVANIDDNEKIKITNVNAVISSFAGQGNTTVKFKNDQASFYTNGTGCPNTYAVGSVLVGSNIFFTCKPAYTPKQIRPTSWDVFTCVAALPNVTGLEEEWVNTNTIKLKWNAVTNAGSYKVMFDGVEKDATTNTYLEISELTPKSSHSWKVKALASDETALDGDYGATAKEFTFPDAPHTVTFNGNGKGTPTENSLSETKPGEGVTLPSVTDVTDGYSFAGWATSSTATTADAGVAGATYKPTADIELFAVYLDVYTINWSANGTALTPTKVIAGQTLVLPEEDPDPATYCEGKTFMGWTSAETVNEDGTGITYAATGDAVSANTTYYAVFAEGSVSSGYTLVDAPEEGKIYIIVSSNEAGDAYALPATGLAETATASTAGTQITVIEKGGKVVVEEDYPNLEFTYVSDDEAKWAITASTSNEYLVINGNGIGRVTSNYKAWWDETNGGLYGSNSKGTTYYDVYLDEENNFKAASGKEGSVFAYVKGGISYSGYTTDCCTKHEVNEGEMTIGGFTASPAKACAGTEVTLTPNDVTGYNFTSWTSSPEVTISAENKFEMPDEDVTITANYTAATYNIEYYLDGGAWDGAEGVAAYTYGVGETLPTNVKKDGNNFAGWYAQDAEDPTTEIGATETGDKSFTAHWIPATSRTITYIDADEHIEFTTKPMSIDGEEPGFEVTYILDDHYQINSIIVKVGETTLTEDEVTWNATSLMVMPKAESFADNVTITFDIQPIVFTVQWLVNGTPVKEIENVLEGTAYGTLTAPEDPADDTFENCDANKFMGWATEPLSSVADQEYFDLIKVTDGYIIDADNRTLYAVFATVGQSNPTLTKLTSTDDLTAGDNIVITAVGENFENLMYQETVSSSYVAYKSIGTGEGKMELTPANIAANNKNYWTLTAGSDGKWKLGDETNGYLNGSSSSNNLSVSTSGTIAEFTISYSSNHFKISSGSKNVGSRSDLTGDNQYKFRMGGTITLDFYKFVASSTTYTNFITNCDMSTYRVKFDANAPVGETVTGVLPAVADVDPTEDYIVPAATLTADRYTQIGWNEDKTATTAQATVEKMDAGENTTLYAIWQAKDFTISVETAPAKVEYKTNATFDPTGLVITKNYTGGFTEDVEYAGNESDFTFEPSLSTPLTTAITEVTITYAGKTCTQAITVEEAVIPTYYWVANATELQAGDQIILVCGDKNTIAGPLGEEKYFASEELTATINKGTVQVEDAYEFTLGKEGVNWTLTSSEGTIKAKEAKTLSLSEGTATWTISFDEKGNASITSTANGYGTIKYNSSSPRFLNYASGQTDIQIYAKRDTRKTLREELADGKMYSFCPAYNLAYVEGAIFYQPDYMDAAYVHFVEATEIKAGYGYILEGLGDDLKAFEVGEALTEAVTADAENTRGMQGVLEGDKSEGKAGFQFTETSYNHVVVVNNHLQYVGALNIVPVGRAYLDLGIIATLEPTTEQARPGAHRVAINFGGQAPTDINNLNGATAPMKVLRDGQLYIIRDTKTYNAQGIEVQ